jgi:hypothetical protein
MFVLHERVYRAPLLADSRVLRLRLCECEEIFPSPNLHCYIRHCFKAMQRLIQ